MAREKIRSIDELPDDVRDAFNNMRLVFMDPHTLTPHPDNPKKHTTEQRDGLTDFIDEVGWVGTLLYNATTGRLLDGHLRQQEAIERNLTSVPVIVIEIPEESEPAVIALYDTIGRLYQIDRSKLMKLQELADLRSQKLRELIQRTNPSGEIAGENEEIEVTTPDKVTTLPPGGISLALGEEYNYVVLLFRTTFDFQVAQDHFDIKKQRDAFVTSNVGIGRVVDGTKYLNWMLKEGRLRTKFADADAIPLTKDDLAKGSEA